MKEMARCIKADNDDFFEHVDWGKQSGWIEAVCFYHPDDEHGPANAELHCLSNEKQQCNNETMKQC